MKRNFLSVLVLVSLICAGTLAAQSQPAWLGASVQIVEEQKARTMGIQGGLLVTKIEEKSPAADAGLEVGDIILSAGANTITSVEAMREVMNASRAGDLLSLGVRRKNGRNEPLIVTLGSAPTKGDDFADDQRVKELREKLRALDADRRRIAEELEKRLSDLRNGKAAPQPQPPATPAEPPVQPEAPAPEVPETPRTALTVSLGATLENLDPEESRKLGVEGGVRVKAVTAQGAAEEGGLRQGDVILRAAGEAVTGTGHMRVLLGRMNPGDKLEVEVLRDGKKVNLEIALRPRE